MQVLIAEDDRASQIMVRSMVSEWGYEPVCVADGDAAWALVEQGIAPDLAILDWMMPGMDGIELCQRIKERQHKQYIYVIMLTTKSSLEDMIIGLNAGADDFLSKPVYSGELRSRLGAGERILQYQATLLERTQQLHRIDQQRNQLLDTVAHDLRNAMVYMRGFSDLLAEGEMGSEDAASILENMKSVSKDTLSTLNDCRDLRQIEQGHFRLQRKQGNIAQSLQARVREQSVWAQEKGLRIAIEAPAEAELLFDKARIEQVFDHLLRNALEYAPEGSTVQVALVLQEAELEISVADQGSGIALEDQKELFAPFAIVENRQAKGKKTLGLGLAIVQGIVSAHGGSVGVDSQTDQGSRFYVRLPRA